MIEVPDPPEGSRIRVEREHAVVALSWRARPWETALPQLVLSYVRRIATRVLIAAWGALRT